MFVKALQRRPNFRRNDSAIELDKSSLSYCGLQRMMVLRTMSAVGLLPESFDRHLVQ